MKEIDAADALVVLAKVKMFHAPQDIGDSVCQSWSEALTYGGATNVRDAVQAVVRHYSRPGANPWITPGDVIGQVRQIRSERLAGITAPDLTRDIDEADHAGYLATAKARAEAIEDGMPLEVALVDVRPVAALERGR